MKAGEIIRLIRTKQGISQREMAEKAGISQNYLSLIEGNKKMPSNDVIADFSSALGISKEAFLFAISDIPSELSERDRQDYQKLKDNIIYLLLFNIKKEN